VSIAGKATAARVHEWTAPVAEYFGKRPMIGVTPADLERYVSHRKAQGIAPGSVAVELRWLHRGFRLAVASNLLPRIPEFPKIEFDNARRVFADWPVVERLLPLLPDFLRPVVLTAHFSGWRKESILGRERALHLDLDGRWLYLERQANKGRAPVRIWLNDALLEALRAQDEAAREIERRTGRLVPWVFFYYHDGPGRQAGGRIRSFAHLWTTARAAAGMPDLRFHDLRRGAVRDLRRDGSTEHEIMQWMGLKSRTVFERYDVVDEDRLREVGERQQRRHEARTQGKVADFSRKP
jgi:integrase